MKFHLLGISKWRQVKYLTPVIRDLLDVKDMVLVKPFNLILNQFRMNVCFLYTMNRNQVLPMTFPNTVTVTVHDYLTSHSFSSEGPWRMMVLVYDESESGIQEGICRWVELIRGRDCKFLALDDVVQSIPIAISNVEDFESCSEKRLSSLCQLNRLKTMSNVRTFLREHGQFSLLHFLPVYLKAHLGEVFLSKLRLLHGAVIQGSCNSGKSTLMAKIRSPVKTLYLVNKKDLYLYESVPKYLKRGGDVRDEKHLEAPRLVMDFSVFMTLNEADRFELEQQGFGIVVLDALPSLDIFTLSEVRHLHKLLVSLSRSGLWLSLNTMTETSLRYILVLYGLDTCPIWVYNWFQKVIVGSLDAYMKGTSIELEKKLQHDEQNALNCKLYVQLRHTIREVLALETKEKSRKSRELLHLISRFNCGLIQGHAEFKHNLIAMADGRISSDQKIVVFSDWNECIVCDTLPEKKEECLICTKDFDAEVTVRLKDCGHSFCFTCIKWWRAISLSCPLCRQMILQVPDRFCEKRKERKIEEDEEDNNFYGSTYLEHELEFLKNEVSEWCVRGHYLVTSFNKKKIRHYAKKMTSVAQVVSTQSGLDCIKSLGKQSNVGRHVFLFESQEAIEILKRYSPLIGGVIILDIDLEQLDRMQMLIDAASFAPIRIAEGFLNFFILDLIHRRSSKSKVLGNSDLLNSNRLSHGHILNSMNRMLFD